MDTINEGWNNPYNRSSNKGALIGNWQEERSLREDRDPQLKYELVSWAADENLIDHTTGKTKIYSKSNPKPDTHATVLLTGTYREKIDLKSTAQAFHSTESISKPHVPSKGRREQLFEQEVMRSTIEPGNDHQQAPAGSFGTTYVSSIGRGRSSQQGFPKEVSQEQIAKMYTDTPISLYSHKGQTTFGKLADFSTPIEQYMKGPTKD